MKRSKDDLFTRPFINFSPAELSGQGQMSTPFNGHRLTNDDARAYLKGVKDIFQDNKETYDYFLEILKDFKAQRVDIAGVISRVKELFKGHIHLILGFNTFLPKGDEMTLPMEDEPVQRKKTVESVDALCFISKIKTRFEDHDNVYRDFLDILHFFREGDMPTTEVYREVAVLLHGHTDLLEEFKHFLPDNLVASYVHYIHPGRDHILRHDSGVSPMINARPKTAERNIHHLDSDQWDCIEKEKEKREDRDRNDWEHDDNMDYTRKSACRDHYVTNQFYQGTQDPVSSFCEKVKEKLHDPKTKFSDCLCSYVASLLGNHAELTKECKDFLNYVEKTGCLESSMNIVRSLKVEEQDVNDCVMDETHKVNECDDRGSDRCGRALAFFIPRDVSGRRMSLCASREKFMAKPVLELDLSKCESCTPSYRCLPQNEARITYSNTCSKTNIKKACSDVRTIALLAEIQEMREKNQNEGGMLLSIGAGYRQPISPHMAFEYSDPEIHGDLYQVIKYSSRKLCTPENHDKIMTIWTTFLESFLGVPPPPHATDTEYVNDNSHVTKSEASLGEGNDCPADEYGSGNCKLDVLKHEDNNIPTEKSLSSGVQMVNDNYGIQNDGFPNADQVTYGSDVISQVHTGVLDQGPSYVANADCGIETTPIIESQDGSSAKPPSLAMGMVRKEVVTNTDQVGELFPNRDLAQHGFSAFENTGIYAAYVSASESAHSDEHCSEEPDEDRDNDGRDNMSESEGEIGAEALMSFSDHFLRSAKPFMVKIPMAFEGEDKNYRIFYGDYSFYLLFRFHQMLYERMHYTKWMSLSPDNEGRILNDAVPTDPYARFKNALYSLLNGSSDNSKFEDDCGAIIGAQSYILFTLDELIHNLVKRLQTIATEEMENKFLHLCTYERSRNPNKFSDVVYHHNACFLLPDDNLYRIECIPSPTRLTIQLMRNEHDKVEVAAVTIDPNFVTHLNDVFLSVPPERREKPGTFLQRNKRKCTTGDETNDIHRSMEGLIIYNGLEFKVNCNTLKVYYVMASEDFMFRTRRRRKALYQKSLCNGSSNGNCHKRRRKLMFS